MIELKYPGTGSWLDRASAPRLAAALADKLWQRVKGRKGLFLTLTYKRQQYDDAFDLYRKQSERHDVMLFLRKVGRHLGENLAGRWFCKLEFQRGGWVHWHIILLDVGRIEHADLTRMWGHGHVWVNRLTEKKVRYACKYVVKAAEVPGWLYGQRPRSVKIIRVSRGFWGEAEGEAEPDALGEAVQGPPTEVCDLEGDPYDTHGPWECKGVAGYVPIGDRIEEGRNRFVARDEGSSYIRGSCDLATLIHHLMRRGCGVVGRSREGWLVIDATLGDVAAAAEAALAAPPSPTVHLNGTSNLDGGRGRMPWWIDMWHRQEAMEGGGA